MARRRSRQCYSPKKMSPNFILFLIQLHNKYLVKMQDQCPCIMDQKCAAVFMQLVTKKCCWFHEMLLHPVYTDRSQDQNQILTFLLCCHSYYHSLAIYMHGLLNQNSWYRYVNVHIVLHTNAPVWTRHWLQSFWQIRHSHFQPTRP